MHDQLNAGPLHTEAPLFSSFWLIVFREDLATIRDSAVPGLSDMENEEWKRGPFSYAMAAGKRGHSVRQNTFAADRTLIQALEHRSQPIGCSEGCILFRQGEAPRGLYILQSGEATLMMETASGQAVMCLQAGAGSLLGLPAIVGNEPYSLTALARKGSEVRYVTRNDLEDVIRTEPSLTIKVLEILAAEVRSARQALSES